MGMQKYLRQLTRVMMHDQQHRNSESFLRILVHQQYMYSRLLTLLTNTLDGHVIVLRTGKPDSL
jgi:hypothetical protein